MKLSYGFDVRYVYLLASRRCRNNKLKTSLFCRGDWLLKEHQNGHWQN